MENATKNKNAEMTGMHIRKLFFYYLSYWKWFLLSLLCFMAAGIAYLFIAIPQYEVTASILIKDNQNPNASNASILEQFDFFSSHKVFENEIEIIRSFSLMKQVTKDLNLQVSYDIKDGIKTRPLYTEVPVDIEVIMAHETLYSTPFEIRFNTPGRMSMNGKNYPLNTLIIEPFGNLRISVNDSLLSLWDKEKTLNMSIIPLDDATENLRATLDIKASGKGSSILNISMLTPTPERSEEIINHLLRVYNLAEVADKNSLIGTTISFIDKRLETQEEELRKSEIKVQNFKSSKRITDISAESKIFLESVQKNDVNRSQVEIQLSVLQDIETYVLRDSDNGGTTPATMGISDPTLLSLISTLSAAESERHKALRTIKPANPIILAYNDQINAIKRNIIDNVQSLRRNLEITQKKLDAENNRLEVMIQSIPKKERELVDITREQKIKDELYIFLLSKREEAAISYASTVADSRLIDPAHSSLHPVQPVKRLILLAAIVLGLLVPVLILWIKKLFYNKISSKEEVEKQLDVPIVGEISQLQQSNKIIPIGRKRGLHTEQIRTLRTNIECMHPDKDLRTVLVTSSMCGEGKSFLTANLGAAFASSGKRTVIIDFNNYNAHLHKIVGVGNNAGIYSYLAGQAALDDIIKAVPQIDYLDIIPCGPTQVNQENLLQNNHTLSALMGELHARYDYVILDTPSLGLMSDARILSRFSDAEVFVIRQNYTPNACLGFINELHKNKQMSNLCVVVNGIKDGKWYGYIAYNTKKYYKNHCKHTSKTRTK